ncbi:MAG: penicillin-binding protein activator [Deltaproteobacteria bacterium]|nr:penicillin-binding protein activator [Deltaproteobacteria bacterium]
MKFKCAIILLSAVLFIWACAPKPVIAPAPDQVTSEDEFFSRAEQLYESESYDEALALYDEYFRRFPDKPLAAAALMKIGIIRALKENYEEARSAFRNIISAYPTSSFVPDAMVEELRTYYQQGRYQDVIELAPDMLKTIDSWTHIFRIYALIGDVYMTQGAPIDALDYYARAWEFASGPELEAIAEKFKEAIAQLDSADVAILIQHPDESLPMDYLLFQLGLNYALEENYGDALMILNQFIEKYPAHENRILAESLIDEIKKNAFFKRYTIGCLLPLSGPYQAFGQRALQGLELAQAQFSSQSSNPPLNIIIKDTGADPDKTITALEELYRDQVAAIIGPIVTSEIAAREAQQMGIPIITLTQKDNIPEIGDKVFRNFITPKMQVQTLTSFTVESLGLYRFAILYPDETYGTTFMNLFWDQLLESGGQVVAVESYKPDQTDFSDSIKKLVGLFYEIPEDLKPVEEELADDQELEDAETSGQAEDQTQVPGARGGAKEDEPEPIVDFDAIFIPDSPGKAGQIVPQLAYHDIKDVYILGTNLWHSDSLIKIAQQYVQGAVMPDGFFAASPSPRVQKFVKDFEETYQETPDFIEAIVYDTAMILFNVVSREQIRYRSEIRDELLNLDAFPGVTGLTRFDENGDAQKKLYLLRVKGRKFVELE